MKFKADFYSKMSVCRHELGGSTPWEFQPWLQSLHVPMPQTRESLYCSKNDDICAWRRTVQGVVERPYCGRQLWLPAGKFCCAASLVNNGWQFISVKPSCRIDVRSCERDDDELGTCD